jgi:non-canonical (house-cleaning) NTP pyrophosphatase
MSLSSIITDIFTTEERPHTFILRVAVGTRNPAKIRAAERALRQLMERPDRNVQVVVQSFDVPSGIADQPFGDDETCEGAKNRAKGAYAAFCKRNGKAPHVAIGMEGGLEWRTPETIRRTALGAANEVDPAVNGNEEHETKDLYCMAWMAIYGRREALSVDMLASKDTTTYYGDQRPVFGLAKAAAFPLPWKISEAVQKGMELGDATDKVFDLEKSKQGLGVVGVLTDGLVDRSHYYEQALILALIPWMRPDLYPQGLS